MTTIVITDGATLNPGDLDWKPLHTIAKVEYYDSTPPEEISTRCETADIIVANKTIISREVILHAKKLRLIAVSATGYNNVDVAAARERGIVVCNVPEYGTSSVAQHTFALILELTNHVGENVASTKKDEWSHELWSYTRKPIVELADKTIGIVGYGRIGRQVGAIAKAFGMHVIFNNRSKIANVAERQVDTEELFSVSDVVSLHCPLTENNKQFVNIHILKKMKKKAFLINTARGQLINEDDLLTALDADYLTGAALDVLSQEPPPSRHALIHHPKCIVTPHNAWISFEARSRLLETTIQNIYAFLQGKVNNVVS